MKFLIFNPGSSSLKFSLIGAHGERTLADGGVDWVQKPEIDQWLWTGLDQAAGAAT